MANYQEHTCDKIPDAFGIRKYERKNTGYQYPAPDGWVLLHQVVDSELNLTQQSHLTPFAKDHINFCPWCGEKL